MVPFIGPHNDGVKSYAARVRNHVQLTLPPAVQLLQDEQPPVLLFAVCDVLPYLQPYDDVDICGYDSIILFGRDKGSRAATFADLDYPVLLQCGVPTVQAGVHGPGRLHVMGFCPCPVQNWWKKALNWGPWISIVVI